MPARDYIKQEIVKNSLELGINVFELNETEKRSVYDTIFKVYLTVNRYEFPLYHFMKGEYAVQDENAWKWIEKFVGNNRAIIFFEQKDDKSFIEFNNGEDITTILSTSFMFPFYITNRSCEYLIAFNQYDYIICSGSAKLWLLNFNPESGS